MEGLHTIGCGLVPQGCGGCHMTKFCVCVKLMFKCVLCAFCNCCRSVKWQTVRNREFASNFVLTLRKQLLRHEMLNKGVVMMMPWVQYQPLQGIHVWKAAKLVLWILNIHIAVCQVRLMKLQKKHESSMMISSGQLMFVTLIVYVSRWQILTKDF